jgi:hypothetical protein
MTSDPKNIAICPDCHGDVRFKRSPYVGQIATCRQCDAVLEVVNKAPLELDYAANNWGEDDEIEELSANKSNRRRGGNDGW